jgi:hypothetical protein
MAPTLGRQEPYRVGEKQFSDGPPTAEWWGVATRTASRLSVAAERGSGYRNFVMVTSRWTSRWTWIRGTPASESRDRNVGRDVANRLMREAVLPPGAFAADVRLPEDVGKGAPEAGDAPGRSCACGYGYSGCGFTAGRRRLRLVLPAARLVQ